MSGSIWVRVVIGDNSGGPIEVEPIPKNVYTLAKKVKEEDAPALDHCPLSLLRVYRPGTAIPVTEDVDELDPDEAPDKISTTATTRNGKPGPLIVVAPPPPQQQEAYKANNNRYMMRTIDEDAPTAYTKQEDDGILQLIDARVEEKMESQRKKDKEEMKEEMKEEIESQFIHFRANAEKERPTRTLSYLTKSHAYSYLQQNNQVIAGEEFFFELEEGLEDTQAFVNDAPEESEHENNAHHTYFLGEMEKLVQSAKDKKRKIDQRLLWTKSGNWLKLNDNLSQGVAPDFCLTDAGRNNSLVATTAHVPAEFKYDVSVVLEQKKSLTDTFNMEIIDYAERILCIQRKRAHVYSALFCCKKTEKTIRWAKTMVCNGRFETRISKSASLCPGHDGQRQLLTILCKKSSELGRNFPEYYEPFEDEKIKSVKVLYQVGEGASATVYAARLVTAEGSFEGVIKVLKSTLHQLGEHEKKILDHLHGAGVDELPTCFKVKEDVLFFDKLLRPFVGTFSVDAVSLMLDLLKKVHGAGVVHRDIRPENILQDVHGTLYLIDWGFAIMFQDAAPDRLSGTFRYGSEAVLEAEIAEEKYSYTPEDDLESFGKTVVAVNSGGKRLWKKVSAIKAGELREALKLWSEEKQRDLLIINRMFEYAKAGNYADLKKCLVC